MSHASAGLLERPATPEAPPLADATGQHAALVLLQRLLRGRAVQNEMYAGKAAKLQLVRELRLGLEGTAGEQHSLVNISQFAAGTCAGGVYWEACHLG